MVSAAAKREFILWFLEKYDLQNREASHLLQYLAAREEHLEHVHFIDNFRNVPKTILISTKCVQMTPFKFYYNKRVTSDVEKVFVNLKNNPKEDVYIGLFFKDRITSPQYAGVVIPNPFDDTEEKIDALTKLQAEMFLDATVVHYLKTKIDEALAARDFEQVKFLSKQICELKGEEYDGETKTGSQL